ncbi:hypothetical protein NPIL_414381 [Nephila pilipes]|uniref:Uncharacterized protein n=1 Tax=Nephila pilipes TaxID=299642 RepID=A0A8X6NGU1_NEPPI|nr:hypothetical protein NPIL_414381 [Nephila pilipes]
MLNTVRILYPNNDGLKVKVSRTSSPLPQRRKSNKIDQKPPTVQIKAISGPKVLRRDSTNKHQQNGRGCRVIESALIPDFHSLRCLPPSTGGGWKSMEEKPCHPSINNVRWLKMPGWWEKTGVSQCYT